MLLVVCYLTQALVPLKRAVDEAVIPAVAKANIRERIAALTRRCLDAAKVRQWLRMIRLCVQGGGGGGQDGGCVGDIGGGGVRQGMHALSMC
jgi:hypothetical protein